MKVRVWGVGGNTAANGVWAVTVPPGSSDTFSLDGSAGTAAYTGGGKSTVAQRITLFEFAGDDPQPWKRWSIRMKGHFSEMPEPDVDFGAPGEPTFAGGFRFPTAELVKLNGLTFDPSGRYGTSIQLDINNMPAWIAAKYWPHGPYRMLAAQRDLIPSPYPGLTVWLLDAPPAGQRQPKGTGHYETWDGSQWKRGMPQQ
jgi:hypothetical protein